MKSKNKFLAIFGAMFFVLALAAVPAKAQVNGVLSSYFNYTFSTTGKIDSSGNFPGCTASLVKACVSGFNLYDVTSGRVKLGTLAVPQPASGAMQITGDLTLTNVAYGTHSFVATAAYFDGNGDPAESVDSLPGTFQVRAPQAPGTGKPTGTFTPAAN